MATAAPVLHKRLRLAGILTATGLVLEVATLYLSHPLTFLAFIFLGGSLVGVGVLLYLYTIVSHA